MSTKRDYYEILNVSRNASDTELKAAYRKKGTGVEERSKNPLKASKKAAARR